MSLNNVQLTTGLLVDLYETALVQTTASSMPVQPPVKSLGKNNKNILIITAKDDILFLTDVELNFLTTILSACKLSLDDVAIVNWNNWGGEGKAITVQFQSLCVLLFDVDPITFGLPLNFPQFQIQEFANRTYLYAPALAALEQDTNLKKQLWDRLKTLFHL